MIKERLFSFLLGVIVTVSIAASTTDLMTVKPAKPIHTICYLGTAEGSMDFINRWKDEGYIVKTAEKGFVVMERY